LEGGQPTDRSFDASPLGHVWNTIVDVVESLFAPNQTVPPTTQQPSASHGTKSEAADGDRPTPRSNNAQSINLKTDDSRYVDLDSLSARAEENSPPMKPGSAADVTSASGGAKDLPTAPDGSTNNAQFQGEDLPHETAA